eukprot:2327733-Pyramimonas_sp.AAC.1
MSPRRRARGSSAHLMSWKSAARRATPRTTFGSSRSSCQGGVLEASAGLSPLRSSSWRGGSSGHRPRPASSSAPSPHVWSCAWATCTAQRLELQGPTSHWT